LFDSLTATVEANDCPGKCVHALTSTFMCDGIVKSNCPDGLRCCVERPPPPPPPPYTGNQSYYGGNGYPPWGRPPPPGWGPPPPPYYRPGPEPPQNEPEEAPASLRPPESVRPVSSTAPAEPMEDSEEAETAVNKHSEPIEDDEEEEAHLPEILTKDDVPVVPTTSPPVKQCPGICTAARMTVHCDGVLNIPNICQKNLKCCVDPDK
ncbi:unnamed protein product, partial [Allacma fusca]